MTHANQDDKRTAFAKVAAYCLLGHHRRTVETTCAFTRKNMRGHFLEEASTNGHTKNILNELNLQTTCLGIARLVSHVSQIEDSQDRGEVKRDFLDFLKRMDERKGVPGNTFSL